ncbi:hypothetical protein EVAR_89091_1 [Eumeta japonica]|uniref:Uncharacterized protein n=1 Tax=Eumeta variegata TaxID=151549 RepID=A0A4C1XCV4_EUMVA|nr:hypothetical protein EVAR_89091_1 [Eumeta japonica]
MSLAHSVPSAFMSSWSRALPMVVYGLNRFMIENVEALFVSSYKRMQRVTCGQLVMSIRGNQAFKGLRGRSMDNGTSINGDVPLGDVASAANFKNSAVARHAIYIQVKY